MSGSFSKEQRRNLVKAVGATAFEAMEQARQLAFMTETRAAAMAKEFLNFEKTTRETVDRQDAQLKQLENRCNGIAEWCQANETTAAALATAATVDAMKFEQLAGTLKGRLDAAEAEVRILQSRRRLDVREHGNLYAEFYVLRYAGFWQRLRWLLTGRLPDTVPLSSAELLRGYDGNQSRPPTFAGIVEAIDGEVHKGLARPTPPVPSWMPKNPEEWNALPDAPAGESGESRVDRLARRALEEL